jgi:hypothetical protein
MHFGHWLAGTLRREMYFAPRISPRLRSEVERLAAKPYNSAEICREVGETAGQLGLRRPSYEQVRALVREARRRPRTATTGEVLLDIAFRVRHPDAFIEHVSGVNTLRADK